jgi:hypothetical protein
MKKPVSLVLLLGAAGLVAGYFLFGKTLGGYVPVMDLVSPPKDVLGRVANWAKQVDQIRQNILISGGVGAVLGLVASFAGARSRR